MTNPLFTLYLDSKNASIISMDEYTQSGKTQTIFEPNQFPKSTSRIWELISIKTLNFHSHIELTLSW